MTYLGIAGLLMVMAITLFKRPIIEKLRNHTLVRRLSRAEWFESHWYAGIFLFLMNVLLGAVTLGLLTLITMLTVPYLHLLLMLLAVAASLYLWMCVSIAWEGEKRDRLKMAIIGSSWYLLLTIAMVTGLMNLEPSSPEMDNFMAAVGFVFGIIVSVVAFTYCFLITGFWNKPQEPEE